MSFVEKRVKKLGLLNTAFIQTESIVKIDISIDWLKAYNSIDNFLSFLCVILCLDEKMLIEFSIQSFVEFLESGIIFDSKLDLLLFEDDTNGDIVDIFMWSFVEDMFLFVLDKMSMQALGISKVVRIG